MTDEQTVLEVITLLGQQMFCLVNGKSGSPLGNIATLVLYKFYLSLNYFHNCFFCNTLLAFIKDNL